MLARHLLFFAARRPHSALLAVPKESVPPSDAPSKQPPPYIEPPQFKNRQDNQPVTPVDLPQLYIKPQLNVYRNESQQNSPRKNQNPAAACNYEDIKKYDNGRANYNNRDNNREAVIDEHNQAKANLSSRTGEQFYIQKNDNRRLDNCNARNQRNLGNEQFYTLPNYRTPRMVEPPRSVTPDITRGLSRGPALSTMHMMARRGQHFLPEQCQGPGTTFGSDGHLAGSKSSKQFADHYVNKDNQDQRQEQNESPLKNRFIVPASLAAVGYRFVAAPPSQNPQVYKSPGGSDPLKNAALSPIAPSGNRSFQSSTPGARQSSTASATAQLCSREAQQVQSNSGRSTPTNLILSPTKSTMSNEELFAAIHKSKRRLNIREETDSVPAPNDLTRNQVSTRHSWSPESQKTPVVPKSVTPLSTTSRLDFKRLLLQQSVKTGPTKLSAAEQLKLSRQQSQNQQQQLMHQQQQQQQQHQQQHGHHIAQPVTPVKVLSPRAVWRFQSPRSDVLSSTIMEDSAAEEKAMKPSPENPSPISRLNTKRQLDLGPINNNEQEGFANDDENLVQSSDSIKTNHRNNHRQNLHRNENSEVVINHVPNQSIIDNYLTPNKRTSYVEPAKFKETDNTNSTRKDANIVSHNLPTKKSFISNQTTNLNAVESRRLNNQLARAQFLASFPATVLPSSSSSQEKTANYFTRHNRARSESPQHSVAQNVSRSPSAPTLETAL